MTFHSARVSHCLRCCVSRRGYTEHQKSRARENFPVVSNYIFPFSFFLMCLYGIFVLFAIAKMIERALALFSPTRNAHSCANSRVSYVFFGSFMSRISHSCESQKNNISFLRRNVVYDCAKGGERQVNFVETEKKNFFMIHWRKSHFSARSAPLAHFSQSKTFISHFFNASQISYGSGGQRRSINPTSSFAFLPENDIFPPQREFLMLKNWIFLVEERERVSPLLPARTCVYLKY